MQMKVKWIGHCVVMVYLVMAVAARAAELWPQEQAMQGLAERIVKAIEPDKILKLKPQDVIPMLSPQERETFAAGNVSFRLAAPAIVSVIRPAAAKDEPFWLEARGFKPTSQKVK